MEGGRTRVRCWVGLGRRENGSRCLVLYGFIKLRGAWRGTCTFTVLGKLTRTDIIERGMVELYNISKQATSATLKLEKLMK